MTGQRRRRSHAKNHLSHLVASLMAGGAILALTLLDIGSPLSPMVDAAPLTVPALPTRARVETRPPVALQPQAEKRFAETRPPVARARDGLASAALAVPPVADIDGELDPTTIGAAALAKSFGAAFARQPSIEAASVERVVEVGKGDTLAGLLHQAGVGEDEAHAALSALGSVYSPKALQAGLRLKLKVMPNGDGDAPARLIGISFSQSVERDVQVTRDETGSYQAAAIAKPLTLETVGRRGVIASSLFEAGQTSGIPLEIMSAMVKAFSYDVDFQRELRIGDGYEVVYEQYADEKGVSVKTGRIIYAALSLSGKALAIYGYTDQTGHDDFYNARGESVRKALLRTPLDGFRITSGFGMRRHPILGYTRMHKGIDFGAPTGTPIYAAGDGTIAIAGVRHGYGNYVQIKHSGVYATAYGHMSRIASGMKPGRRVQQGQVIGYVGQTGMATGPHLHYEVLKNGSQINPLNIKFPTGSKLAGSELKRFQTVMAEINRLREQVGPGGQVASRDTGPKPTPSE